MGRPSCTKAIHVHGGISWSPKHPLPEGQLVKLLLTNPHNTLMFTTSAYFFMAGKIHIHPSFLFLYKYIIYMGPQNIILIEEEEVFRASIFFPVFLFKDV